MSMDTYATPKLLFLTIGTSIIRLRDSICDTVDLHALNPIIMIKIKYHYQD